MTEGIRTQLKLLRPTLGLGAVSWGTLLHLVPDPMIAEKPAMVRAMPHLRESADLRARVQRVFKGSKGNNVAPYAAYIAAGLRGDLGNGWSTPPLTLWCPAPLTVDGDGWVDLPLGEPFLAIDAETQLASKHKIWSEPDAFGLTRETLRTKMVGFELYWGITIEDARQIFHDRNRFGVPVDKTLAIGMDARDLATEITQRLIATTVVDIHGGAEVLSKYVSTTKNLLGVSDIQWVTLSALRTLVICTIFGPRGITMTSSSILAKDLPEGESIQGVAREVIDVLTPIIQAFTADLSHRSAICRPGILSGIGATAHHAMSWSTASPRLNADQVLELLSKIHWDSDARTWAGIAARSSGGYAKWSNGVKDVGRKSYNAMIDPTSETGMRIRGN